MYTVCWQPPDFISLLTFFNTFYHWQSSDVGLNLMKISYFNGLLMSLSLFHCYYPVLIFWIKWVTVYSHWTVHIPVSTSYLILNLKNNKAAAFDMITNEMIKSGVNTLLSPLLLPFNSILSNNIYPAAWKMDILGPLHKSGPKDDCNNYCGICVNDHI